MIDVNCSKVTRVTVYDDEHPPKLCANIRVIHVTDEFVTCLKPVCAPCNCSTVGMVLSASPTTASPEVECRCPSSVGTTASENGSQVVATSASTTEAPVSQAPVTRTTRSVLFDSVLFAEESALSSARCAEVPLLIGIGLLTIAFLVASAVIFGQRWSLNARQQEVIRLARVIELNNLNGWIGEFDELAASNEDIPQFYN